MPLELRIAHLYPDLLNLYGDRGNIAALVQRARWRAIAVEVTAVPLGAPLAPGAADLFFIGGGEDRQQVLAARDLQQGKGRALRQAVADGAVVLAVCGGYQLMGHYYRPAEGEDLPGIGLLDLTTEHPGKRRPRLIGNIIIEWVPTPSAPPTTLVGFENHGGRTTLGPAARPLGRVLAGSGNNGGDRTEGAVSGSAFGTYLHGPLLPKNPQFADYLLTLALRRRYGEVTLAPLDDQIEARAHDAARRAR